MLDTIRRGPFPLRLLLLLLGGSLVAGVIGGALGNSVPGRILQAATSGCISGMCVLAYGRWNTKRIAGVQTDDDRRAVETASRTGRPADDPRLDEPTLRYVRWQLRRHQRYPLTAAVVMLPLAVGAVILAVLVGPLPGIALLTAVIGLYLLGLLQRIRARARLGHLHQALQDRTGRPSD
jgi:hypothetical protein